MIVKRMHGCGNSFILVDPETRYRNNGDVDIGKMKQLSGVENLDADGLLVLTRPGGKEFGMQYYDIDRATKELTKTAMCGNGIRCLARYAHDQYGTGSTFRILTGDGVKEVTVSGSDVNVKMGPVKGLRKIADDEYFLHNCIAHIVYLVPELEFGESGHLEMARTKGRKTRYDQELMKRLGHPEGFQVNFSKKDDAHTIKNLTYEAGVEDLTLACGTGSVAAAYINAFAGGTSYPTMVINRGGDLVIDRKGRDLYMVGPAEYI